MTFVATLEPEVLWKHFDRILTIPRGSKNEEQIREYVVSVSEELGLAHRIDSAGNVVVKKPGSAGREKSDITILQAHLDMVNEKNSDVDHDFASDPIQPERADDYLTAKGTTLGSDNGIGVATMLALAEASDVEHGPLELLFTVDEETGLTGAAKLDANLLEGRQLINLDSEEEGILYVGCAGGGDSNLTLKLELVDPPSDYQPLRLEVKGLKGGHSGADIHMQRANAIKVALRCLLAGGTEAEFLLSDIAGGNMHNAIPREAHATVWVGEGEVEVFKDQVQREFQQIRSEFQPAESQMDLSISDADTAGQVLSEQSNIRLVGLLAGLPHGVISMSFDMPGLVETSTNLAKVRIEGDSAAVLMSSRSSIDHALEALRREIRAVGELAGARVEEDESYPGWNPNLDSKLLEVVKRVHEQELGQVPEVKAIHAGLECGIIGKKIPDVDMISIGPQIEFPHSPDERVHIGSVSRFYLLLTSVLKELS